MSCPSASPFRSWSSRRSSGKLDLCINALAVLEPGKPRPIGREGIGQQPVESLRSCHLLHLLNERARHRRFLALLPGLPAQESPGHDDGTGS